MIEELKVDYVGSKNQDQMVLASLNMNHIFSYDEIPGNNLSSFVCKCM